MTAASETRFRGLGRLFRLARADLRYGQSGSSWLFFLANPLLQILVYSQALPFFRSQREDYVLFLCAGLLPWQSFSESVVRASQALVRNAGLLRALPLRTDLLVAQSSLISLLGFLVVLALLLALAALHGAPLGAVHLWLPVLALLMHAFACGLGLLLAPLRVLFPAIQEAQRPLFQIWMWATPIVYAESLVAHRFPWWLRWNPPYAFVRPLRALLLEGAAPDWASLQQMIFWTASSLVAGSLAHRALRAEARDLL